MAGPSNYSWDLGFDYSSALNDFSQYNLAMVFQKDGVVASPMIGVSTGNNLFFNLFNIGPSNGACIVENVTIEFRRAVTGSGALCPFSSTQQITLGDGTTTTIQLDGAGNATLQVGSHLSKPWTGPSSVFGPGLPGWSVVLVTPMTVAGDFEVAVSVIVQGPDGTTKSFVGDPEMVVGSTDEV